MDLGATVQGIAATLTRYGVKRVYGDRLTYQWIVEAFKRHGVEYVHPTIRRQGNSVYVTRSLAYLEAGPLFRTGAVKILDDPVTCRELRNLELRGDKVDHRPGPTTTGRTRCAWPRSWLPNAPGCRSPATRSPASRSLPYRGTNRSAGSTPEESEMAGGQA